MRRFLTCLIACVLGTGIASAAAAQTCPDPVDPYDSGGRLDSSRSAYDVGFYDLSVRVDPDDSTITGRVAIHARIVRPTDRIAFDLDTVLGIESVSLVDETDPLVFRRCGGRVFVTLPRIWEAGRALGLAVAYGGRPRVARRAPWDGGFVWARTGAGAPWIATANQTEGPDVWWPVKDHVSDKPDSMAITVTVPEGLVAATNGRLESVEPAQDGWATWRWFVSTPISAYNVALNIAPYATIDTVIASVAGDSIPVVFYVLPDDLDRGRAFFPEILAHLQWFERRFGPYPFRADKYGVAQTPHLGMEHQSIIAYGANFNNRSMTGGIDWGFDALHHHELSHEWFGNVMTNADWKDMWLHEGFGTYAQVLWLEDTQGVERSREYLQSVRRWIRGQNPVATRESATSQEIGTSNDMYFKGAWALHTLRWLIGDEAFFASLRRLVYTDPALEASSDGAAVHFSSTAEYVALVQALSGQDLQWLFDVYVYTAQTPELLIERNRETLTLTWQVSDDREFPLPVGVAVDGEMLRVEMPDGTATVPVPADAVVVVDPDGWILMEKVTPDEQ